MWCNEIFLDYVYICQLLLLLGVHLLLAGIIPVNYSISVLISGSFLFYPAVSDEPAIKELPKLDSAPLQHLNKARPRRAKTKAATRPLPAQTPAKDGGDDAESGESVDVFFKPVAVSTAPVMVTPPSAKPRSTSVKSDTEDKSEKHEGR